MIRRLVCLARDESGASLIEMGLALPILSVFMIGTIDLSRGFNMKLDVEQAAQSTLETVQQQGYNHSTTTTPTSLGALEAEAVARAGTGSTAVASAYLECRASNGTGARTTLAYTGTSCGSGSAAARYVSIVVTKTYTPMFGIEFAGADANGTYTITGEAAIRTQ